MADLLLTFCSVDVEVEQSTLFIRTQIMAPSSVVVAVVVLRVVLALGTKLLLLFLKEAWLSGNGGCPTRSSKGLELGQGLFRQVGSLLRLLQLSLSLPELGQVHGSDLLGLLDLFLKVSQLKKELTTLYSWF